MIQSQPELQELQNMDSILSPRKNEIAATTCAVGDVVRFSRAIL